MKVIITGTTGYVGEGVMQACLDDERIEKVLSVSRKPLGYSHPKLEEYIVPDFMALQPGDVHLQGYDAVYFCAGISSVGIDMATYKHICQDIPLHFAEVVDPREKMVFTYVSGGGTSDTNPQEWAKIKSSTEKQLMSMGFRGAYGFRPMLMYPHPRQQFRKEFQRGTKLMYPLAWLLGMTNPIVDVARAMISLTEAPIAQPFIGIRDIRKLAKTTL